MRYQRYAPTAALSDVVDWFYVLEHDAREAPEDLDVPANCSVALALTYGDRVAQLGPRRPVEPLPRQFLTGPTTQCRRLRLAGRQTIVGAVFKAAGVSRALNVSARDVLERRVPLEHVIGSATDELVNRVRECDHPSARVAVMERFLLGRLHAPCFRIQIVDEAVGYILKKRGAIEIESLSEHVNVSPRQLRRYFQDQLGLGPKRVARIKRFSYVNLLMTQRPSLDWQDVIVLAGFYDQAHFIKEFTHFAGIQPSRYQVAAAT